MSRSKEEFFNELEANGIENHPDKAKDIKELIKIFKSNSDSNWRIESDCLISNYHEYSLNINPIINFFYFDNVNSVSDISFSFKLLDSYNILCISQINLAEINQIVSKDILLKYLEILVDIIKTAKIKSKQYRKDSFEWNKKIGAVKKDAVFIDPDDKVIEESVEDNKKYVDYVATHNVMCGYDSEYKPGEKEAKIKKIADIISCFAKSSKKVMDWFTTEGEPIDRYTPSDEKVYLLKIYSEDCIEHTFDVYFCSIRNTFVSNLGIQGYCSFIMSAGDLKRLVDITDEEIYQLIEKNKNSPQTLYFQGIRQRRKDTEKEQEVIEESVLNEKYYKKVSKLDFINKLYKEALQLQMKSVRKAEITERQYKNIEESITEKFKVLQNPEHWYTDYENYRKGSFSGTNPILRINAGSYPYFRFVIKCIDTKLPVEHFDLTFECDNGIVAEVSITMQEILKLGISKDELKDFYKHLIILVKEIEKYNKTQPTYQWTEKGVVEVPAEDMIEESIESTENVRDNEMILNYLRNNCYKFDDSDELFKNSAYDIIEAIRNSDDIFVGIVNPDTGLPCEEKDKTWAWASIVVNIKYRNKNRKVIFSFSTDYRTFSYSIEPSIIGFIGMGNITSSMMEQIYNIPSEFVKDCIQLAYNSERYKYYKDYDKKHKEIPLEEADELPSMEDIEKEISDWDETKEEEALLNKVGELIPTIQYRLGKFYLKEKCRAIIDMVNHPQNWEVVQRDSGSHFLRYNIKDYEGLEYFTLTYDAGSVDEVISNTYISYILSLVVSSNSNSVSTMNIYQFTFSELMSMLHLPLDICRILHDENIKYSQMFRKHIYGKGNVIEESFEPKKRYEEIVNPDGLTEEKVIELENNGIDEDEIDSYWWELENNIPERKRIINEIRNGEAKVSVFEGKIFVDFKDKEQMQIVPLDYKEDYGQWNIGFLYMYNIFLGHYSSSDLIHVFGIDPKIVGEALSNLKIIKVKKNGVIEESVEIPNNLLKLLRDTLKIKRTVTIKEKHLELFSELCKKFYDEKIVDWIINIASKKIGNSVNIQYFVNLVEYMKVLTDIANHKEERLVNDNEYGESYIEIGEVGARVYRSSVHPNELFIRIGTAAFDPTIKEAVELLNIKPETISKLINLTPEYNISYSQRKEKEQNNIEE